MKFYRVKQISENQFIPQVKFWFLGYWYGICNDLDIWYVEQFQINWCVKSTLGEAKAVISEYKELGSTNKIYPKIHKL